MRRGIQAISLDCYFYSEDEFLIYLRVEYMPACLYTYGESRDLAKMMEWHSEWQLKTYDDS